jgi:hypothetical protein
VKLAHLAACVAASVCFPAAWGWTMAFTLEMILINGWMGVLSFRGTVALTLVALVAYLAAGASMVGVAYGDALRVVGFAVGVIWLSRVSNFGQRVRWRLLRLFGSELRRLRGILFDVLPANVAQEMVRRAHLYNPPFARDVFARGGRSATSRSPTKESS